MAEYGVVLAVITVGIVAALQGCTEQVDPGPEVHVVKSSFEHVPAAIETPPTPFSCQRTGESLERGSSV
jgi:Flp pilus assembly pilin Flp